MNPVFNFIRDEIGLKTKHLRIVDSILQAISGKELVEGDILPSVIMFIKKFPGARMTVVKTMEKLKEQGIIEPEERVGYFVKNGQVRQKLRVKLFLAEFNVYHEVACNKLTEGISNNFFVDFYFPHCNSQVFKSILKESAGQCMK